MPDQQPPATVGGGSGYRASVISVSLARVLKTAGLAWTPASGDRMVVADRDMDGQVFVLSDMTVEVHEMPGGPVVRFNGTTEWALDSLELDEVLWLPAEDQLRCLLGDAFAGLSTTPQGYAVRLHGHLDAFTGSEAAEAYGQALLALL